MSAADVEPAFPMDIHCYQRPDAARADACAAYDRAMAADLALRELLASGQVVQPHLLRDAETQAAVTLMRFIDLVA